MEERKEEYSEEVMKKLIEFRKVYKSPEFDVSYNGKTFIVKGRNTIKVNKDVDGGENKKNNE